MGGPTCSPCGSGTAEDRVSLCVGQTLFEFCKEFWVNSHPGSCVNKCLAHSHSSSFKQWVMKHRSSLFAVLLLLSSPPHPPSSPLHLSPDFGVVLCNEILYRRLLHKTRCCYPRLSDYVFTNESYGFIILCCVVSSCSLERVIMFE